MKGNGGEAGLLTYFISHVNTDREDFTLLFHIFPARKHENEACRIEENPVLVSNVPKQI